MSLVNYFFSDIVYIGKSAMIVRLPTYDELFGQKIFAIRSKCIGGDKFGVEVPSHMGYHTHTRTSIVDR